MAAKVCQIRPGSDAPPHSLHGMRGDDAFASLIKKKSANEDLHTKKKTSSFGTEFFGDYKVKSDALD
jgi:hypothetical protein